jgi:hypothetical protein
LTRVKANRPFGVIIGPDHRAIPAWPYEATVMSHPFAVPSRLPPDLARVHAYWRGLLRGEAEMPFWDDANLTDLPDLADRLFLVDVFQGPERFRFGVVGKDVGGEDLGGRFLDETTLKWPLEYLRSQCCATTECAGPSYFQVRDDGPGNKRAYSRLLLPMWGDGHLSMILGCVDLD